MKRSPSQNSPRWKKVLLFLCGILLLPGGLLIGLAVGIPGSWVRGILEPKLPPGFQLELEQLRYRPGQGILLRELDLFTDRDRVTPLLHFDELSVRPRWAKWISERQWEGVVAISGGKMETNLGTWADDLVTDEELRVNRVGGELEFGSGKLRFRDFQGSLPTVDLLLNGEMDLPSPGNGSEGADPLPRAAKILAEVLDYLEYFDFEAPPRIRIEMNHAEGDQGFPMLEIAWDHQGSARYRGLAIVAISAHAVYRDRLLEVRDFMIQENEQRALRGRAVVNFARDEFEVYLENTLRRFGLEAVSPFSLGNMLDSLQLRVEDRCDFTLQLGPNPFSDPSQKLSGSFVVENAFYRDTFFPQLSFDLVWDSPRLALQNVKGRLGQGKGEGPVSGQLELEFETGRMVVGVDGAFYPDNVISIVGSAAEKYLREWEFRGKAPVFSLQLRQEKNGVPLEIEIDVEGRDVLWRGTAFDHIGAEGTYADDTLTVRGIRAGRGTERFEGGFVFEPHFRGVTFSFHSTFYLPDILQLIGPEVSRIGQWFRFRGDSKIEAAGFLDLSPQKRHDFHGSFAFQDLVLQWLSLNQLEGNLRVEDQRLSLPDLRASLEGGTLQADFQSEETFSEQGHFVLDLELENMDLYKVITKATDLEDTPYRGNLSLDLDLTGKLRDSPQFPRNQSYQGGGRVEIREGSLFRIPLLLGLSQLLSKLVNGFGYASQSDFTADFEIADGRISSKELFLQGNILSIAGPGSYRFEDRKISADLKIHLLKEGVLSDALKLILWPIRKLIEIQLTGTLDQPSWQPKNLPKEIFGK